MLVDKRTATRALGSKITWSSGKMTVTGVARAVEIFRSETYVVLTLPALTARVEEVQQWCRLTYVFLSFK